MSCFVFVKKSFLSVAIFAGLFFVIGACGGGGGGGGGSGASTPVVVTPPSAPSVPSPSVPSRPRVPSRFVTPSSIELSRTPALADVSAANVYRLGVSGETKTIGVVDSGVDRSHSELMGRVIGGGDWQSIGSHGAGVTDPFGHGTHVASIIAAAPNNSGIQGIAPLASIVSYRILNNNGTFGDKNGNSMVPSLLGDAFRRRLPVLNNSWSSFYEITDLSPRTIQSGLNKELPAYRKIAHAQGPVLVWAAGNGGDNNVSVRAGLPYYFPELQANWLSVVSVDLNGREPRYTNRCGISAAWCITAPGGGDHEASQGIEAARSGGGYTRKSGTSMAAPLVSGAVALVLEHMPNLSPRQAAARLLETAHYRGLVARNGCTIDSCSEDRMRAIFGQGMIDVEAALKPIGSSSVVNNVGQGTNVTTTYITTPSVLGDAVKQGLKGRVAVVEDHFDGAQFLIGLDSHVETQVQSGMPENGAGVTSGGRRLPPLGFIASVAPSAPSVVGVPARLVDVPSQGAEAWHGYGFHHQGRHIRMLLGHGDGRQAAHVMVAQGSQEHERGREHEREQIQDSSQDPSQDSSQYWFGGGFDRSADWLDGGGRGALDFSHSQSAWVFGGRAFALGGMTLTAEALLGRTQLAPLKHSLLKHADVVYDSWSLRLDRRYSSGGSVWGWVLSLEQPPALREGRITLEQPYAFEEGGFRYGEESHRLGLGVRQKELGFAFHLKRQADWSVATGVKHIANLGHRANRTAQQFHLLLRRDF